MYSVEELFEGCQRPPPGCIVMEPFVGDGTILKWLGTDNIVIPYDEDPKQPKVIKRDCIREKPKYYGTYVVTRAPQLSKAAVADKTVFEAYGTDDYYKCFIKSLRDTPNGGIIVLPLNFMTGIRDSESKLRLNFFGTSKPTRFNIIDEKTVVISFRRRMGSEDFPSFEPWVFCFYPEKEERTAFVDYKTAPTFIIETLNKPPINDQKKHIDVSVCSGKNMTETDLVLVKKERKDQKIGLYMKGSVTNVLAEDKDALYIRGFMSKRLQKKVIEDFNQWINYYRTDKLQRLTPRINLEPKLAEEAIRRILWSYACDLKLPQ
jgi:hypothetical protein